MADGAVNFLLDKLTFTLVQEASLLGDAQNAIEEIKLELESMRSLMKDAERSKEKSESVKTWVGQVRDVAYEVEDIIDEFLHNSDFGHQHKGFLQAIAYFPHNMTARRKIHSKLQKIKAKAYEVSERSNRYGFEKTGETIASSNRWQSYGESSRLVEEDDVVGMDENAGKLVEWLTEDEPRRTIISVVGMGGLGKTTLVTEVYNDQMIKRHFNCCAWISVTQAYGVEDLLRSMIKELLETNQGMVMVPPPSNLGSMKSMKLLEVLFDNLQEKRYLIVLDDVWSIDLWNLIRSAFPSNQNGSRIILTTRNENVPASVGKGSRVYRLHPLRVDAAWTLFCKKAFWDDPTNHNCPIELQTLARSIVNECEGLPLAIIAIGGLMSSRKKTVVEWNKIYESLNWQLSNNLMLERVKAILMLSLNDLPFYLKHCFLYCCVFRDGYPIKRKKLIRLWVAEGFITERKGMTMEEIAEDYLTELIFRNMIQVIETNDAGRVKTCRVHDIMRKIAMTTSEEDAFCASFESSSSSSSCDSKRQLKLEGKTRRLSLYNSRDVNIRLSKKMAQQLRSFFVFQTDMCSSFSLNIFSSKFKFLRVLELKGVIIDILPSSLVNLFNLRYLNLQETKILELPNSMDRLMNLQTLDIRNTNVKRLPDEISKLQKLRHLYMYTETCNVLCSMKAPKGIWNARSLQSLACVEAEEELIRHVRNLSELKRLEITGIKAMQGSVLCASIQMLTNLCRLGLTSISDGEELGLEGLSRPPVFLQKLTLVGRLKTVPPWLASLKNLTHLYLGSSQVEENIVSSLHSLTTLVLLELKKAYNGKILHFNAGWFPRLNTLKLMELQNLDKVRFEEKALASMKELHLNRCPELNSFPEGIGHLTSIQELHLEEMSQDFVGKLRSFASGNMQTAVRQIPRISLVYLTGQTRIIEML